MRTRLAETGPRARSLVVVLVLAIVWATVAIIVPNAEGAQNVSSKRFEGADRYETARAIAVGTFKSASFALLARGDDYPDALAGNYLAGVNTGSPILLTPSTQLSSAATAAFQTLGVKGVAILGGVNAISAGVEKQLQDQGYQTQRLSGANRYATAAAIAKSLGANEVGSIDGAKTAIVASGEDFADALSGGPMSFKARLPTLLTTSDTLPPETDSALTTLGIKHVLLLGGSQRISGAVVTQLTAKQITVERLAGNGRLDTAVEIAKYEITKLKFSTTHVNLGRSDPPKGFADPLAGGPHAGVDAAPILLAASPTDLGTPTKTYLEQNSDAIASIDAFGGTDALSDATLAQAKSSSTCFAPPTTTTSTTTTTTSPFPTIVTTTSTSTTTTTTKPTTTTSSATSTTIAGASTSTTRKPCPSTTTSSGPSTTATTGATSTTSTTLKGPGGSTCPPFPPQFCQNFGMTQTITGGF